MELAVLRSALAVDAKRRREKAERKASVMPPQELAAHNRCIEALAELPDPRQALAVVTRIARSISEFIAAAERGP